VTTAPFAPIVLTGEEIVALSDYAHGLDAGALIAISRTTSGIAYVLGEGDKVGKHRLTPETDRPS